MGFHARRFGRAAASYGGHSGLQDRMAGRLLDLLPRDASPARALEIGCGTGHLTRRLRARLPEARLAATDAAPAMLAAARAGFGDAAPPQAWLLFDAEGGPSRLGEADPAAELRALAPFDMIAGNAVVQWFPDLAAHLSLMRGLLGTAGIYLVSGFGADNFPELNAILAEPPFGYARFPGHGRAGVEMAAAQAGLRLESWTEESVETRHGSPREFLDVIRALGSARRPEEGRPLTRARLAHLEREYLARYGVDGGVKATWRPWYALLRNAS